MKPFTSRFAQSFACFALFCACLPGFAFAADTAVPAPQDATAIFMQLERDIPSLYLVNGLYLSDAQLKQWIPLLEEFRKTSALKGDRAKTTLADSETNITAALEKELSRNGNASSFKASDIGATAQLLKSRKDIRALMDDREKESRIAAEKVLALLTPAQRGTVEQFVPCFIPPNDFKNPERVGQASADSTLEKVKTYLLNPGILDVLKQRAGHTAAATPATTGAAAFMEIKKRGEPLKAAGLLASLDVTPNQAGQLLPIVREAVKARQIVETEARAIRASAIEPYLRLRDELAQQQPVDKTESEARQLHVKVNMLFQDTEELLTCQVQADRILSADQVAGLANFKPRQSKRGKNPLVEKTRQRSAELLDRGRAMKPGEFQQQKEALCRQFVLACVEDAAKDETAIDTDAEIMRSVGVLEKARSLDGDAFGQSARELTAELCPRRSEPRETLYGWQKHEGDSLEVMEGSTELLFSDAALDVLQKLQK
ncbi:MAG: hypothetical protein HY343_11235 [Lentisphaerae bacterium]|nr:hypothetical protein [Lentisphaerota bacterium]